jgi:hypothetical protein
MICRTSCVEMSWRVRPVASSSPEAMRSRAREKTRAATPAAWGTDEDVPLAVWVYPSWIGCPSPPGPLCDAPGTSVGATTSRCAP